MVCGRHGRKRTSSADVQAHTKDERDKQTCGEQGFSQSATEWHGVLLPPAALLPMIPQGRGRVGSYRKSLGQCLLLE